MAGVAGPGAFLRQRREAKGLSVADVSRATRIAPRLLDALEQNHLDSLPAPVFVRGFIRAYSATVDAPVEDALRLYEASCEPLMSSAADAGRVKPPTPAPPARPAAPARPAPPAPPRGLGTASAAAVPAVRRVLLVGGLTLVLASLVAYFVIVTGKPPRGATPAPQPAPSPAPTTPPPPAARPAQATTRVLVMRARDRTWVKVSTPDAPPSEALLQPGNVREWRTPGRFTVTVGNAAGVVIELDGVALPPLGKPGEVVRDLSLPLGPAS